MPAPDMEVRRAQIGSMLEDPAAIRNLADQYGIDEGEVVDRLESEMAQLQPVAPISNPAPILPAAETITPGAQFAQQMAEVAPAAPVAKPVFDESEYPALTEDDFAYAQRAGRPPKTSADEGLFGALPTQEALDKREQFQMQQLEVPREQRIAEQEAAGLGADERIAALQEREIAQREETLGDIEFALRAQAPENAVYKVQHDPEDTKAPYKLLAETKLGKKPEVVLSAPTLQDFSDAVYGSMGELTPFVQEAPFSAQSAEPGREMEPTVATAMVQELTQKIDDAREAGQIDNNQRAELLGRLERPDSYYSEGPNKGKPKDLIALGEARAREALSEFRNAKTETERNGAEAKLKVINDDLAKVVRNTVVNPISARLKSMSEMRADEKQGAKIRRENATLQRKLGEMEGVKDLAPELKEEREAKIAEKEAKAPLQEQALLEDPDAEEAKTVEDGLRGKTPVQAAEWLAKDGPDELSRTVAAQVAKTLRTLERFGAKFELKIVNMGDMRPRGMSSARGYMLPNVPGTPGVNQIWLHGADVTGLVGTSYRTSLHELIHAATIMAFRMANRDPAKFAGTSLGNAVVDLKKVANAFVDAFNSRVKEKQAKGEALTEYEEALYKRNINAIQNFEEVIAWGLSDRSTQEYLASIPYYGKQSLWSKFVAALKKLFTLPNIENSALAELLRASEELMNTPDEELSRVYGQAPAVRELTPIQGDFGFAQKASPSDAKKVRNSEEEISIGTRKTDMSQNVYDLGNSLGDMIKGHDSRSWVGAIVDAFPSLNEGLRRKLLTALPTSAIVNAIQRTNKAISDEAGVKVDTTTESDAENIVNRVTDMQNMKQNLLKGADKIALRIRNFTKQGDEATTALSRLMSISRINGVPGMDAASDAMQTNKALVEIERRLLKNVNDVAAARTAIDTIKSEVTAHKDKSATVIRAVNVLNNTAIDSDEMTRRIKQLREQSLRVRDTMEAHEALSKFDGGLKVYELIRQYYEDMFNAELALLNKRILSFPDPAGRKHLREMRAELMEKASKPGERQKAGDMFYDLPADLFPKDYFPFMREGEYWVVMKGTAKRPRALYTFDSAIKRDQAMRYLAKEHGISADSMDSTFLVGSSMQQLVETFKTDDAMMQKVFEVLEGLKKNTTVGKADVQDITNSIYQVHLMSTSERSAQRRFLKSEEVVGFSKNVELHFLKQATSYANQLSKLQFAADIRNAVSGAEDNVDTVPLKYQPQMRNLIGELGERAEQELNPNEQSAGVNLLNRVSFIYFLTGGATALTNLTSVPIRVVPRLWRDFGYAKGTAMWLKYMKLWDVVGLRKRLPGQDLTASMPTVMDSKLVKSNPLLMRAAQEGNLRNILDSAATVLTGDERTTPVVGGVKEGLATASKYLTYLFTASENITRQAAYFMAFEAQHEKLRKQGVSEDAAFDQAVDYAVKVVSDTLGDYGAFERPRLLKSDWLRAASLFKMYSIKQTQWMVGTTRDLFNATKGSVKGADKQAARAELAGILREVSGVTLLAGLFGGLAGMPLYTTLVYALQAAFGDDDDDDIQAIINKDPALVRDPDLWFRAWMKENFGQPTVGFDGRKHRLGDILVNGPVSELTDLNIGSRTSMDLYSMWFRDSIKGDTTKETVFNFLLGNVAGGSLVAGFSDGYDDFNNGDITRGLKKMLPAAFRNWVTTGELSEEGVTTRKGDTVMGKQEFNALNLAGAALGLRSQRLSELQNAAITITKYDKEIERERNRVMQDFDKMATKPDVTQKELYEYINVDVAAFNRKYPVEGMYIDMDALERSLTTYLRNRKMQIRGVGVTKRTAPRISEALAPFEPME